MTIHFILVEPAVPENVGACARALATMGFEHLRLVNTQAHRAKPARILAHGSRHVLENACHFTSLGEAVADMDLVVGSTAKERHQRHFYHPPEALPERLQDKGEWVRNVALVFGREESGLHRHEVDLCDMLTYVPMAVSYPSLNLSHAVMIYAYQLSRQKQFIEEQVWSPAVQTEQSFRAVQVKVREWFEEIGVPPSEKLQQWAWQRLPMLSARDIGFVHQLIERARKHYSNSSSSCANTKKDS